MPSAEPYDAMAADPFADLPDRTALTDGGGRVVLAFCRTERVPDGTPWADLAWVPEGVPVAAVADVVLPAMRGWLLSTTERELAAALTARGAVEQRHAHVLTHALTPTGLPALTLAPSSVTVRPLTAAQAHRHADRLGAVYRRAYDAGHPDAFTGSERAAADHLRAIAAGTVLGPLIGEVSSVALVDAAIVGACLVVDRAGAPPYGGPWVLDVFRDPACPLRGIGQALLTSSLGAAAAHGHTALSLAVSDANEPARRLYHRLGFTEAEESWTLTLP